ncbi:unnamed protein product [Caenorhabditis angaria]|uniref:Uncharacterized protein n=1 Tax=Caenorhabditis angaria TaxID=860376 RepID=A0A9P1IUY8_9PELO|nr:unnamed protein product [Caenorhabditis angaria]
MRSFLVFFAVFAVSSAYVFDCLDQCECDTDDEVVHCHNGERTELKLPQGQRLRGFPVIGLTYNKIVRLPDEKSLLAKFPDLKVIDVERNPDFDCNSLEEYNEIKIVSDCFKNVTEISKVPKLFRPTKDCDIGCQAERHYAKLHKYVLSLWEILKEKYENFDLDETLQQIQRFFVIAVNKINKLGKDINDRLENNYHPKSVATPLPDLEEVQIEKDD